MVLIWSRIWKSTCIEMRMKVYQLDNHLQNLSYQRVTTNVFRILLNCCKNKIPEEFKSGGMNIHYDKMKKQLRINPGEKTFLLFHIPDTYSEHFWKKVLGVPFPKLGVPISSLADGEIVLINEPTAPLEIDHPLHIELKMSADVAEEETKPETFESAIKAAGEDAR